MMPKQFLTISNEVGGNLADIVKHFAEKFAHRERQ
jgi:hypothetical protein